MLKACEVSDWNWDRKSFPTLSSLKIICIKRATFLGPVKKAMVSIHVWTPRFFSHKFNAKSILFKKNISFSFTGSLRYPNNDAKGNRLYRVSVVGKLYSNKGPLLSPSCTDSFLLSQLMDAFWLAWHSSIKKALVLFSEHVKVPHCYIIKRSRRVPELSEVRQ